MKKNLNDCEGPDQTPYGAFRSAGGHNIAGDNADLKSALEGAG